MNDDVFKKAWEIAAEGMVLSDKNGMVLFANQRYCHIYGFSKEEVEGKNFAIIFPKEFRAEANEQYKSVFMSEQPQKVYIEEIVTASGEKRIVESRIEFVYEGNHKIAMLSVIKDITRQQEAENKLIINNQRYRRAQEIGNVGNWEYNIKTKEFWGSEQAKKIYELPANENSFDADAIESCIIERERVHQALADLIETNSEYNLEFDIITLETKQRKSILSQAILEKMRKGIR